MKRININKKGSAPKEHTGRQTRPDTQIDTVSSAGEWKWVNAVACSLVQERRSWQVIVITSPPPTSSQFVSSSK